MTHVKKSVPRVAPLLALMAVVSAAASAQCTFAWDQRFGVRGIDGTVYCAATYDDGGGPALYVGGAFAVAETAAGANVAKRSGNVWISPGGGIPSTQIPFGQVTPPVTSLTVFDDGTGSRLYASRLQVYRLMGSSWVALTSATTGIAPGGVNDLEVHDDGTGAALYAIGSFFRPGGTFVGVARWNGTDWVQVGADFLVFAPNVPQALCLEEHTDALGQSDLYAGGYFSAVGAANVYSIARWNGSAWVDPGGGVLQTAAGTTPGRVDDMHAWNGHLYACGDFAQAGPVAVSRLARWDGSAWSSIGNVLTANYVFALGSAVVNGVSTLFVGGQNVSSAGGIPVANVAAYTGSWSPLGSGITTTPNAPVTQVRALHGFNDGSGEKLYVGGRFNAPGGQANGENITSWNGMAWSSLAAAGNLWGAEMVEFNPTSSSSPTIYATCVHDDGNGPALYVGGWFNRIGGIAANNIAKFNGTTWLPLGAGLNNAVTSMQVFNDGTGPNLFVGGYFSQRLARWNGTTLSAAPGWTGGQFVASLAVYDDGTGPALWVGRTATNGSSPPGQSLALMKWTPGGFVPFTRTITHAVSPVFVYSLTVSDWGAGPRLVVGGLFSSVGGAPSSAIFAWNGTTVDTLGGGFASLGGTFPLVEALTTFTDFTLQPKLVAGGVFAGPVGGLPARCIAQWNGAQWSALGTGVDQLVDFGPEVLALRPFRDGIFNSLFVGGRFLDAGGTPVSNLARWDGAAWSDVGGGARFVGKALRSWVADFGEYDFGFGQALVVAGAFNTVGSATGAGLIAPWTPSRPSISFSQSAPGAPLSVQSSNLVTGHEYFGLFSTEPCAAGAGSGPFIGLCVSNLQTLLDQVTLPVGAAPFHYVAGSSTMTFGPFAGIPPLFVDAVSVELTGPGAGCPSLVTRFAVQ